MGTHGEEREKIRNNDMGAVAIPESHVIVLDRETEREAPSRITTHALRHTAENVLSTLT